MSDKSTLERLTGTGAIALGAALLGFAGGWAWQATGAGRSATEQVVRNYILENPEILPEAIERLQEKQLLERLEPVRETVETPYPGMILGNPAGTVTLVEFTDYACPYCRMSVAEVDALITQYPELKVVVRENPVLSPESVDAARMALAAADQGKYEEFHKAMFTHERLSAKAIDEAASEAGLDIAKAKADIETGKYDFELENNNRLSNTIGFTGTPAWVVGNKAFSGAVGRNSLAEAIEAAGES